MYKIIGGDGKEYGPISVEVLRQWIAQNRVNSQTRVLAPGATEWKLLSELPEFAQPLVGPQATPLVPGPISLTAPPRTHGLAVSGMVLGILSVTFGFCCCTGLPFGVAGVICSSIALHQINQAPQVHQGKALAIAGLVLSLLDFVVAGLFFAFGWWGAWPGGYRKLYGL